MYTSSCAFRTRAGSTSSWRLASSMNHHRESITGAAWADVAASCILAAVAGAGAGAETEEAEVAAKEDLGRFCFYSR